MPDVSSMPQLPMNLLLVSQVTESTLFLCLPPISSIDDVTTPPPPVTFVPGPTPSITPTPVEPPPPPPSKPPITQV
ncbi:hypothetical protein GQ55_1G115200 [Panicum hallii var. hallii]|uniref:Uncharacterized protein n=1 Tax=Panicum hallii var. hallii TaxID=1504633 RepID=A0A2T7F4M5_9POAL|nr:hypothetical protein GQ55_1G115200 [Panicum hallii var. hallii]